MRREIYSLTPDQRSALISGILAMKRAGAYNWFPEMHGDAAMHFTNLDPDCPSAAHQGPAFLPWHRKFILEFEARLKPFIPSSFRSDYALPYWRWEHEVDARLADIWQDSLMGGDGDTDAGDVVKTGPFRQGEWTTSDDSSLRRHFDEGTVGGLPSTGDVAATLNIAVYDVAPWNINSSLGAGGNNLGASFRNQLEGWLSVTGVSSPRLHNQVHAFIGGHMNTMRSPDDPVFFLHHCNVDRIWTQWQQGGWRQYAPASGAKWLGQNLNDPMWPWDGKPNTYVSPGQTITPQQMWNVADLSYSYA
jgi:tyrosinase